MKPISEPLSAERYYYMKWKSHCFRLMLALTLLSNCIVWAIVAALYSNPILAIWLCVGAVFATFASVIEYRACDHFHTRYLRALCDWTAINTDHTNQ